MAFKLKVKKLATKESVKPLVKPAADHIPASEEPKPEPELAPVAQPAKKFALKVAAKPAKPASETQVGRAGNILWGTGVTKKKMTSALHKGVKASEKGIKEEVAVDTTDKQTAVYLEAKKPDEQRDLKKLDFGTRDITESQLDESQRAAVEGMDKNQYACLIGKAGTGKTTTSKAVVRRFEQWLSTMSLKDAEPLHRRDSVPDTEIPSIAFVAFTGRATEQLKKALPKKYHSQVVTIHRLLGYAPEYEMRPDSEGMPREVKVFRPTFNELCQLPHDAIFADEGGMIPIELFNEIMVAKKPSCRVYLAGDLSQLEPVQGRSVLGFAMNKWPTFELTHIHRTALDNPVIANAHRVLEGKMPRPDEKHFLMMELSDGSLSASSEVIAAVKKLHGHKVFDELKDGIIVPQNTSALGQENLNSNLISYFNPTKKDEHGVVANPRVRIKSGKGYASLAVGDKIMNTQNDRSSGLTNGMTGVVTEINLNMKFKNHNALKSENQFNMEDLLNSDIDAAIERAYNDAKSEREKTVEKESEGERQASHITTVKWENGAETKLSTRGQYNNLLHAYAFTCHKAQGGEYDTVVIVVHASNSAMLCQEWLYTAITRAKKRVILLYNYRGLSKAVKTKRIKGNTIQEKAKEFLQHALQAQKKGQEHKLPILPTGKVYSTGV